MHYSPLIPIITIKLLEIKYTAYLYIDVCILSIFGMFYDLYCIFMT